MIRRLANITGDILIDVTHFVFNIMRHEMELNMSKRNGKSGGIVWLFIAGIIALIAKCGDANDIKAYAKPLIAMVWSEVLAMNTANTNDTHNDE